MKHHLFIRALTLAGFVSLLFAFLLFRGGYFNDWIFHKELTLQGSPNGGTISGRATDSLPPKKDSTIKTRLSSSKSLVVTDNLPVIKPADSNTRPDSVVSISERERTILSSSKSAIIVSPRFFINDSIRLQLNTRKQKKKKWQ